DLPRLRREFGSELAAPGAVLEDPSLPSRLLDRRDVLPGLVVAGAVAMMRRIEDAQPGLARRVQDPQHVRNAAIGFRDRLDPVPDLAALGDEVVVGVDDEERGELLVVVHVRSAQSAGTRGAAAAAMRA